MKYFLATLSILLFLPMVSHVNFNLKPSYNNIENFNPTLSYINTIDKLTAHVDSIAQTKSIATSSLQYVEIISSVIQDRFYHGQSHYLFKDNWIAVIIGYLFWDNLSCKVLADDIIKDDYAICSQQEIVMMAVLRQKSINYRAVFFSHHYALEASVNNNWYYFDVNKEPLISGQQRLEANWHDDPNNLKKYYTVNNTPSMIDFAIGTDKKLRVGRINEMPAPYQMIFEKITLLLSRTLWIFPLLLIIYLDRKKKFSTKKNEHTEEFLNYKQDSKYLSKI